MGDLAKQWKETGALVAVTERNINKETERIRRSHQRYLKEGKSRVFMTLGNREVIRFNHRETEKGLEELALQMDSITAETFKFATDHFALPPEDLLDFENAIKKARSLKTGANRILDVDKLERALIQTRDLLKSVETEASRGVTEKWDSLIAECGRLGKQLAAVKHAHLHPEEYNLEEVMKQFTEPTQDEPVVKKTQPLKVVKSTSEELASAIQETTVPVAHGEEVIPSEDMNVAAEVSEPELNLRAAGSQPEEDVRKAETIPVEPRMEKIKKSSNVRNSKRRSGWSLMDISDAPKRTLEVIDEEMELTTRTEESVSDENSVDRLMRSRVPRLVQPRAYVSPPKRPVQYFTPGNVKLVDIDEIPLEERTQIVRPVSELHVSNLRYRSGIICQTLRGMYAECDAVIETCVESATFTSAIAFKKKICDTLQVLEDLERSAVDFETQAFSMPSLLQRH